MRGRKEPDYYQVLGVDYGASYEEMKASYRRLIQQHSGDKNKKHLITEAWNVLSDPVMKKRYDSGQSPVRQLRGEEPRTISEENVSEKTERLREAGGRNEADSTPGEGAASKTVSVPTALKERYENIVRIGQGGMGVVYKARDKDLERDVAIKVLQKDLVSSDVDVIERLKREAQILARFEREDIVSVYNYGKAEDGTPYIVKKYVDGCSLSDILRYGPLELKESLRIAKRVAVILRHVHAKGVIHCDVKPGNILIDRAGKVYLEDFGIARVLGETPPIGETSWGSAQYTSPEQKQGNKVVDRRTDIYSFGWVLYEMLVGDLPSKGLSPNLASDYRKATGREMPEALERIILKCIQPYPADRFQNAGELRGALKKNGIPVDTSQADLVTLVQTRCPRERTPDPSEPPSPQSLPQEPVGPEEVELPPERIVVALGRKAMRWLASDFTLVASLVLPLALFALQIFFLARVPDKSWLDDIQLSSIFTYPAWLLLRLRFLAWPLQVLVVILWTDWGFLLPKNVIYYRLTGAAQSNLPWRKRVFFSPTAWLVTSLVRKLREQQDGAWQKGKTAACATAGLATLLNVCTTIGFCTDYLSWAIGYPLRWGNVHIFANQVVTVLGVFAILFSVVVAWCYATGTGRSE